VGQFEDGAKAKVTTHSNLSNFPANMMASYLVRRFPKDPVRLAQAEELCRFVEDQFVDWEPPYDNGRSVNEYGKEDDGSWNWFCRPTSAWSTPCVLEQYYCYVPVSASSAKTINTLLDVWKATGKDIYLAKARAIADAQTRMIEHDGFLNTWSVKGVRRDDHRHHTWINCTMEIMSALSRIARETR
jgi:maltose/maltodextrin transport system substrate-binding protein